jgi:hypothetical protein
MDTFVIRVWIPGDREEADAYRQLRGFIEHVGSGSAAVFKDPDELIALIRSESAERRRRQAGGGPP